MVKMRRLLVSTRGILIHDIKKVARTVVETAQH